MGFRFRKSIHLGAGIRINLSKRGVGASIGTKGARYTVGPTGRRATFTLPGTGLSYQTKTRGSKRKGQSARNKGFWARLFGG